MTTTGSGPGAVDPVALDDLGGGATPLAVADVDELVALCALAMGDEVWSADDLEGVVFPPDAPDAADHPGGSGEAPLVRSVDTATLVDRGDDGGLRGAVSVSVTEVAGMRSAHLQLLVVHPARRRRGVAAGLVAAAERWAAAHGSTTLTVGAGAPFYLFTGVDARWTEALCCFEALGYERVGAELDLVCPTVVARRERPRDAVTVEHVADEDDAATLASWVERAYPHWAAEFARGARAGTVVLARTVATGELIGAAAHSVSRFGVVGPVAVSQAHQGAGVGAELMSAVLADLSVAGLRTAEIAWTSTVRFYARACDARVGRTSVVLRKELAHER